jgi:glycerol-3-phosphate dehydrogenase
MTQYDVVIIGAGIQGAACAQALSAAGYQCLVLERHAQPAVETSSRSSKLIHGGLRYLESGQFSLVFECLRERKLLLRNASELVQDVPFYIPVYHHSRRRAWKINLGLWLYRLLGGGAFKRLRSSQWSTLIGLKLKGLEAVFQYYDAQTDDVALTHAVLYSAKQLGASLCFNAQFSAAQRQDDAYQIQFQLNNTTHECQAKMMINAAGPWVNHVLDLVTPKPPQLTIDWVGGTHIVLPAQPMDGIYYVEAREDGRAVFIMPWQGKTLIGTTETHYQVIPDYIAPTEKEIDYLLTVYNDYFCTVMARSDVQTAFAGLRVLPRDAGSYFNRPRDTIIYPDDCRVPRCLSLYGGKLTASRAIAEKVVKQVASILGKRKAVADTRDLKLKPYRFV